ncbi:MAG: Subtilisin BL [Dehalococcoidia bacterium]|nr:Subtilisin BL [Chloroflexota bacterium]
MKRMYMAACSISALMTLAACGGAARGPGPVGTPPPPPAAQTPPPAPTPTPAPPPAPVRTVTAELSRSEAAFRSNADYAHTRGITGEGVTIAIIDSGINLNSREFQGRISAASRSFEVSFARCGTCVGEPITYDLQDVQGHGTAVTSIAAAAADANGIVGIAPKATILALKVAIPNVNSLTEGSTNRPAETSGVNSQAVAPAIRHALVNNAFVMNMSFAGERIPPLEANLFAAMSEVRIQDRLVVKAVSNWAGEDASRQIGRSLVGDGNENKNWILFGLQLDAMLNPVGTQGGTPGAFADRTLSVVARNIQALQLDETTQLTEGNSLATPAIAGAAALLKQHWPQLGGERISRILLDTARDLGTPGPDELYGVGLLDIQRAMTMQNPLATSKSGSMIPIANSTITTGGAFGAGLGKTSGTLGMVTVVDQYNRDWNVNLSHTVSTQHAQGPRLAQVMNLQPYEFQDTADMDGLLRMQDRGLSPNPVRQANQAGHFAFRASATATIEGSINGQALNGFAMHALRDLGSSIPGSNIAYDNGKLRFSASHGRNNDPQNRQSFNQMEMAHASGLKLAVASLNERDQVLGSRATGAFQINGAATTLVTAGYETSLGPVRIDANATIGTTMVQSNGILEMGDVQSSAFGLTATTGLANGWLSISANSPLKVTGADAILTVGRGFDLEADRVKLVNETLNLTPDAREVTMGMRWTGNLNQFAVDLGLNQAFNAGHIAGEKATAAWVSVRTRF